MDILEIVRKGLDVELNEVFSREASTLDNKFRFTQSNGNILIRLEKLSGTLWQPVLGYDELSVFIISTAEIIREPFKPQDDQLYWYIDAKGTSDCEYFCRNNSNDLALFDIGNCYKTEEASLNDVDKWKEYYDKIKQRLE